MERLEAKKINGRTYYYYSHWAWVDGKCRRVWQKYLGKLENIVKAVEGGSPGPRYAEVFQWGLPEALWKECTLADVVGRIDKLCPKRDQGLTTGQYIALAAINRAMAPVSKRSMWGWFSQTSLMRHMPNVSKEALTSQRFWDHMARIEPDVSLSILMFTMATATMPGSSLLCCKGSGIFSANFPNATAAKRKQR